MNPESNASTSSAPRAGRLATRRGWGRGADRRAALATALAPLLVLSALFAAPAAALPGACPANEAIRAEQHATALPDCRAYEQVSPLDKNDGDVFGIGQFAGGGVVQAAANGEAVTYLAETSFAAPQGAIANQYLSTRDGPQGWGTQNITAPANAGTYSSAGGGGQYKAFSSDLSLGLLLNGETGGTAPIQNPPLPSEPEAPPGYQNFYLRTSVGSALRPLLSLAETPAMPAKGFYMVFEGASPDLRHLVVSSDGALTPGAVTENNRPNLFLWTQGLWHAINVLPSAVDEETTLGSVLGSGGGESHTISDDGERVFFRASPIPTEENLYVREIGAERTVQVDAPRGGPGAGPGEVVLTKFQTASASGEKAFFTSHAPLTSDANTGPPCGPFCKAPGNDLYMFNTATEQLVDLSPDHRSEDEAGANVQGVVGASEDGSYLYFVARGLLTSGLNDEGQAPIAGADNLYVSHEDQATHVRTTSFIATLSPGDESPEGALALTTPHDWNPRLSRRTARVTPSGRQVVFMSDSHLLGYDNVDSITHQPDQEVYLYDAGSERLSCASCNPSGAPPIGPSSIPRGTSFEVRPEAAIYDSRVLSEDGRRVFFDSHDALTPQDTNRQQDVYEYTDGHPYLISGGTGEEGSEFVDASASGNDVFFRTDQQLVGADVDRLVDLYDARVGGGLAEPLSPLPCSGEACKGSASQPPPVQAPSSAAVSAPPTPRHKPRHKHKAHRKHPHARRAGGDHPRGSR